MNTAFFLNSVLLGAALAMDAFSVSCANGLNEPAMKFPRMSLIAGVYAAFQFLMPLTGWICVHSIVSYFTVFQKFIPWIALILLAAIGVNMIREGIRGEGPDETKALTWKVLLLQGIATSIDALSAGFTITEYGLRMALIACLIIAAVTFAICMGGLVIGKKVGTILAGKASILGGIILIAIGIEIFITSGPAAL